MISWCLLRSIRLPEIMPVHRSMRRYRSSANRLGPVRQRMSPAHNRDPRTVHSARPSVAWIRTAEQRLSFSAEPYYLSLAAASRCIIAQVFSNSSAVLNPRWAHSNPPRMGTMMCWIVASTKSPGSSRAIPRQHRRSMLASRAHTPSAIHGNAFCHRCGHPERITNPRSPMRHRCPGPVGERLRAMTPRASGPAPLAASYRHPRPTVFPIRNDSIRIAQRHLSSRHSCRYRPI